MAGPSDDDHAASFVGDAATVPDVSSLATGETALTGASPATSASALAVTAEGTRYTLGSLLGKGGMGEVRLARDLRVDRDVAVKVLHGAISSPGANARFLREARIQGRLDHPAVVPVHDLGLDEHGVPYFAMKRLTGTTLADALAGLRAGDPAAAARWPRRLLLDRLVDVCLAIEFAHARGVVHRDLKPGNVMLGDYGEAYVLDWGVARVIDEVAAIPRDDLGSLGDSLPSTDGQTADGALLGTPGYMPPEQMLGERVDPRADVYALGCILFEILTLHTALPLGTGALGATLAATAHHPAARHPAAEVPPELDEACAHATAPVPAERTPNARELAAAIRAYLDGDRDLARRRELAQAHADAATRALGDGDRGRGDAMREAGRALALDPTCDAAQRLLGQLLLEPPAQPVPAVQAAVEAEWLVTSHVQLRSAARVYLTFALFVPLLVLLGAHATWLLVVLGALILCNAGLMGGAAHSGRPLGRMAHVAIALHGAILALVGVLFSPLLAVPLLAIGSIAAFTAFPMLRKPITIVVVHLAAVAIPLGLEWAGALPRTFTIHGNAIQIQPWALDISGANLVVLALVAFAIQAVTTALLITVQRGAQEAAQHQVHVQSWHLRQLLPERARTPATTVPPAR
jgi:serine/threonine-protein kinase